MKPNNHTCNAGCQFLLVFLDLAFFVTNVGAQTELLIGPVSIPGKAINTIKRDELTIRLTKIKMYAFLILLLCVQFTAFGLPNPAAVYCTSLNLPYDIESDKNGDARGYCTLPNGKKVDEWDFYRGKVGLEYSYCAIKGYRIKNKIVNNGSFTTECAVCEVPTGGTIKEIPVMELMKRNGDWPEEPSVANDIVAAQPSQNVSPALSPLTVPSSYDLRNLNGHNYINGIRNQGSCEACWAFAAIACAEGAFNFATDSYDSYRQKLSESFLMWCLGNLSQYHNHFYGCTVADFSSTEMQALVDSGSCDSSYFPYTTTDPGSCTHWGDPRTKYSGWQRVTCGDINAIKNAIYAYGSVDAFENAGGNFQNYTGGYVYSDADTVCNGSPHCYNTKTTHAASLVGWGNDGTSDYWILRNSWGAGWGESGYMRIRVKAAAVSCVVTYLQVNPSIQRNYSTISKSQFNVKSGYGVELVAKTGITINSGFTVQNGAGFTAIVNGTGLAKRRNNALQGDGGNSAQPRNQDAANSSTAIQTAILSLVTKSGEFHSISCKVDAKSPMILSIYSANGRLIFHKIVTGQNSKSIVNLPFMKHGLYIAKITSGRFISSGKFIS